jgi:hypothetical protein
MLVFALNVVLSLSFCARHVDTIIDLHRREAKQTDTGAVTKIASSREHQLADFAKTFAERTTEKGHR